MFHSSTQKREWLFPERERVDELRIRANQAYCDRHAGAAAEKGCSLLSPQEEMMVVSYYLKKLVEFCSLFNPPNWAPLPHSALSTAAAYFKRFYTQCSVMEFPPRDMFLCCVFLAFKVEEYNVSLEQFVNMLAPQLVNHTSEFIIGHELLLLEKLKFHLTIHSPFRPVTGFILDMKTRAPQLPTPDMFRKTADSFLVQSLGSDVSFLYPPSQIALAALWFSAKQTGHHIDGYILSVLLNSEGADTADSIMDTLQNVEEVVLATRLPDGSQLAPIEAKLQLCNLQALSATKSRKRRSEDNLEGGVKKHKPMELSPW